MVTIDLAPGDHTIEWSLSGYETITATINVSTTGVLSCVSLITGLCADFISIVGTTITGLLEQSVASMTLCDWIISVGGWNNLNWTNHVLKAYYVYIGTPGYTIGYSPVTWNSVLGLYWYYLGLEDNGKDKTGCEFT